MGHPHAPLLLTTSLAWLASCAPCPDIEQASVWDPRSKATQEQVLAIQHAMADFPAWTGVSELCVLGVKIAPIAYPQAAGVYKGEGQWMKIEPDNLDIAEHLTIHELCHAWDDAHGWPSLDHPEIFRVEDVDRSILYPTAEARRRESFADSCGYGPYDVGIAQGLEEACGLDLLAERKRWVTDHVYTQFPMTWGYEGEIELTKTAVPLPDHDYYLDLLASDDQLIAYVADLADLPHEGLWLGAPPSDHEGGATTDFPPSTSFLVVTVDPATGEELSSLEVTDLIQGSNHGTVLLAGGSEPLLVGVGDEATVAWRIDLTNGTASKAAFPPLWTLPLAGFAHEDRAWVVAGTTEDWHMLLREVDLGSGDTSTVLDRDGEVFEFDNLGPAPVADLGDTALFGRSDGNRSEIISVDPSRASVTRTPVSERAWTFITAFTALPDGRLLLELTMVLDWEATEVELRTVLGVLDPEHNTWQLDPTTCSSGWEQDLGYDGTWGLFTVGGQAYTYAVTHDEQDNISRFLLRLGLPD